MTAREKVCHALLELLKEKNIQDITVSELIQSAGVSRSSYYYYFYRPKNILDDMLQDFLKKCAEILDSLDQAPAGPSEEQDAAIRLVRHFYEHQTLVTRLFFSNYHDQFISDLTRVYISALEPYDIYAGAASARRLKKVEDQDLAGLYAYSTGYAFAGRMEWWARCGFSLTPEEFLEHSRQIKGMACTRFVHRSPAP